MEGNFEETSWFRGLKNEDKDLVNRLIKAQKDQGDMLELKFKLYHKRLPRPRPLAGGMDNKDNLPAVKGDCKAIRKAGQKYGFTDAGPEDIFIMEDNPT